MLTVDIDTPQGLATLAVAALGLLYIWKQIFGTPSEAAVVAELWIYPIKSCKGVRVRHAEIDNRGFKYDRRFMVVTGKDNKFISQRTYPRMALIVPEIDSNSKTIVLNAPGMPELRVSLSEPRDVPDLLEVVVWNTPCQAQEVGTVASNWFSRFLEIPEGCKLVRIADSFVRKTNPKISKNNGQTAFADEFPFLLTSMASLADFNEKLENPIGMENFRPNIVVKGNEKAYSEDSWKRVLFNKTLEIDVVQPCARCKLPNNNPDTGVMDEEFPVSKMLQKYRNGEVLNFKSKAGVFFGVHLDNPSKLGPLVGSSISVGHSVKAFMQ